MPDLGQTRELQIVKLVDFGAYLAPRDAEGFEEVLLPAKEVPEGAKKGDSITVFLYRDSDDRPIATTMTPALTLHGIARLKVAQVTPVGAFLYWGLPKDLFLPYAEQTARVREGDEVLAALYLDKSDRLCATMNLHDYLRRDSGYKKEDRASGTVYQLHEHYGAFVAIDDIYDALLPLREITGKPSVGDRISARITEVRDDGRLTLSLREKAHLQMDADTDILLRLLDENGGTLDLHDRSTPDDIRAVTGMSKNQFKRAVGRLFKLGLIERPETRIKRL